MTRRAEVLRVLARPSWEAAPLLLGWTIRRTDEEGTVAVRLTEVEAYAGPDDPASHAFRGPTKRNAVMFGPAGRLYVYRSYGMHWAMNVVTGETGLASAVLLRAGRVVEGLELARERRAAHRPGSSDRLKDTDLARGPGNLGRALGVTGADTGTDLTGGDITLEPGPSPTDVSSGYRVGVTLGHARPWRFWASGEASVSAYRRSPRIR